MGSNIAMSIDLGSAKDPPSPTRTQSGGFKTSEGTLYVSKPFKSKTSKKMKALIKFTPRKSHFDTTNERSGVNEFRGFFSLFWISMFLFTVRSYVTSMETHGHALNLRFASMFSEDAITLAISDAILVLSTGICVPFAKAVSKGWLKYHWVGLTLQHLIQTFILFTAITWTFNRQWPWVQSGFLTLHSLVMIMKMHSYMTVNGNLQDTSKQADQLLRALHRATEAVGGYDQAILAAKRHRMELDNLHGSSSEEGTPLGTPGTPSGIPGTPSTAPGTPAKGEHLAYVDADTAQVIRQRLKKITGSEDANLAPSTPPALPTVKEVEQSTFVDKTVNPVEKAATTSHPLVDHPNEEISSLAEEYSDVSSDLTSTGPQQVKWPANITWKNFAVYQLIPTLVYELEYPRTDRIRPLYVFEKTVATFGTFALLYTVTETFILPYTTPTHSFARALLDLALPFMIAYILLFYIIFECICNGFAELSYFADRQFYEDWWNSTSQDEFSRKWNKPVHTFLLRHVYASTISAWKVSRFTAMFLTFLLSACAHELVMVVVTKKIRMYLFVLQLIQLPLIAVGRLPIIKRNKLMGNVVFWLGLYAGFPLLCVAYVTY